MTKMFVLARLMFIVLGLYALQQVLNVLYYHAIGIYWNSYASSFIVTLLATITIFIFVCIATYYLLFKSDDWAYKLTGPVGENERPVDAIWIIAAFRLTAFFCGLMFLAGSIQTIINSLGFILFGPKLIIDAIVYGEYHEDFPLSFVSFLKLVAKLSQAALGIYLVLGAPHFIHWQIKKYDARLIEMEAQND